MSTGQSQPNGLAQLRKVLESMKAQLDAAAQQPPAAPPPQSPIQIINIPGKKPKQQ